MVGYYIYVHMYVYVQELGSGVKKYVNEKAKKVQLFIVGMQDICWSIVALLAYVLMMHEYQQLVVVVVVVLAPRQIGNSAFDAQLTLAVA